MQFSIRPKKCDFRRLLKDRYEDVVVWKKALANIETLDDEYIKNDTDPLPIVILKETSSLLEIVHTFPL